MFSYENQTHWIYFSHLIYQSKSLNKIDKKLFWTDNKDFGSGLWVGLKHVLLLCTLLLGTIWSFASMQFMFSSWKISSVLINLDLGWTIKRVQHSWWATEVEECTQVSQTKAFEVEVIHTRKLLPWCDVKTKLRAVILIPIANKVKTKCSPTTK